MDREGFYCEEMNEKLKYILIIINLCMMTTAACIVYTWDYRSSSSLWHGFRTQPLLGDEVQTFKALISVHKIIREGHPSVSESSSLLCLDKVNTKQQKKRYRHLFVGQHTHTER